MECCNRGVLCRLAKHCGQPDTRRANYPQHKLQSEELGSHAKVDKQMTPRPLMMSQTAPRQFWERRISTQWTSLSESNKLERKSWICTRAKQIHTDLTTSSLRDVARLVKSLYGPINEIQRQPRDSPQLLIILVAKWLANIKQRSDVGYRPKLCKRARERCVASTENLLEETYGHIYSASFYPRRC